MATKAEGFARMKWAANFFSFSSLQQCIPNALLFVDNVQQNSIKCNFRGKNNIQHPDYFWEQPRHTLMSELPVLAYSPPWYLRGDPDTLLFALMYGVVALATIWLLEHICGLVLFSTAQGILLSDAAAHIALNNSNWVDVARWLYRTRRKSRLCRRALLALILRCLLVAIDIGILLQAVPGDIVVYENTVGGTELSFAPNSKRVPDVSLNSAVTSCKPDIIRYEGFSATATRTICIIGVPNNVPNTNTSITTFFFLSSDSRLRIRSTRMYYRYLFQHSTRLIGGQNGSDEDVVITANRDVIELAPQAALVTSEMKLMTGWNCTPKRTSNVSAIVNCTNSPTYDIAFNLHRLVILKLFDRVGTVKINPNGTSYRVQGRKLGRNKTTGRSIPPKPLETQGKGPRLGIIRRPRLCIYPATILLLVIAFFAILVRLLLGSHDFAWKLWLFLCYTAGMGDNNTPFETRCQEIHLFDRINFNHHHQSDFISRHSDDGSRLDTVQRPRHLREVPEEYET